MVYFLKQKAIFRKLGRIRNQDYLKRINFNKLFPIRFCRKQQQQKNVPFFY